jgi:hypothetical protein
MYRVRQMPAEPQLVAIRTALTADREALRAAVDRVPLHLRSQRPSPDRWSVAEVLEHLAIVEERSTAALAPRIAEAPALAGPGFRPDDGALRTAVTNRSNRVTAPDFITPTGQVDAETAWAKLQNSREQLMALIHQAEGRDLSTVSRTHPVLGAIDGYQWLMSIGGHEARHTAQILEIAAALSQ